MAAPPRSSGASRNRSPLGGSATVVGGGAERAAGQGFDRPSRPRGGAPEDPKCQSAFTTNITSRKGSRSLTSCEADSQASSHAWSHGCLRTHTARAIACMLHDPCSSVASSTGMVRQCVNTNKTSFSRGVVNVVVHICQCFPLSGGIGSPIWLTGYSIHSKFYIYRFCYTSLDVQYHVYLHSKFMNLEINQNLGRMEYKTFFVGHVLQSSYLANAILC